MEPRTWSQRHGVPGQAAGAQAQRPHGLGSCTSPNSGSLARGGAIGALVELPVSASVATLHVVNGRKALGQAVLDFARSVSIATAVVGSTVGVVATASALGVTVGTPVLVGFAGVGGSLYAWNSGEGIWQAIGDDTRAAAVEKVVETKEAADVALRDGAGTLRDQVGVAIDAVSEWFHMHKSKFRL